MIAPFNFNERPSDPRLAEMYDAGRKAALDGCYRVLACPESESQRQAWLAGWDAGDKARGELRPVVIDGKRYVSRELSNPTPEDFNRMRAKGLYIPTEREIADACLAIQAGWTPEERHRRKKGLADPTPAAAPRSTKLQEVTLG